MSASKSSALGVSSSGSLEVKATRSLCACRSYNSILRRSLFACCVDFPDMLMLLCECRQSMVWGFRRVCIQGGADETFEMRGLFNNFSNS